MSARAYAIEFIIALAAALVAYVITDVAGLITIPKALSYLDAPIPIGVFLIVFVILAGGAYLRRKYGGSKVDILSFINAQKIVALCAQPKDTYILRMAFDQWQRQSNVVAVGGYSLEDYLRILKKRGYLKYDKSTRRWQTTPKAADEISHYHGLPSA